MSVIQASARKLVLFKFKTLVLLLLGIALSSFGLFISLADDPLECPANFDDALAALNADYPLTGENASTNAFALGAALQDMALACGYQASAEEVDAQIKRTLSLAPLSAIIAASSIGQDLDVAMAEIENLSGDPFNGQMLFNGLEMGLDGAELGCAACHDGAIAPEVEGTWTRADEVRLLEPQFADYDVTRYLVESILHPQAYIVPEFTTTLMPNNFWARMDAQQLADLVAYLESQDQELSESN
jgi:hypothetical protein